jgi:hypothetical protein
MLAGLVSVVGLGAGTGCQTYFAGQTLPSPRYMEHYPQYFMPDPAFPLQKELNSMMETDVGVNRGGAAAPAANLGAAPTPAAPTQR